MSFRCYKVTRLQTVSFRFYRVYLDPPALLLISSHNSVFLPTPPCPPHPFNVAVPTALPLASHSTCSPTQTSSSGYMSLSNNYNQIISSLHLQPWSSLATNSYYSIIQLLKMSNTDIPSNLTRTEKKKGRVFLLTHCLRCSFLMSNLHAPQTWKARSQFTSLSSLTFHIQLPFNLTNHTSFVPLVYLPPLLPL